MPDVYSIKQQEVTDTPLFLFECQMKSGAVERWSTHSVSMGGDVYHARILGHNLFEMKSASDDGADAAARLSLTLANADSYFSEIEWNAGWKGSRLAVKFAFFDLVAGAQTTAPRLLFQGVASAPDEMTETTLRVTFTNRLNLQRVGLPEIRIQKRCPWLFPGTAAQRVEAVGGGALGRYSPFYRCGYSADVAGGRGSLQSSGQVYASCDYTRESCTQRGMFDKDAGANVNRRFGGVEFVPASMLVRSFGEKGSHVSPVVENEARYNDYVPLVYGTAWYQPPVVFARNDGNLTRTEVLLGVGEMTSVLKVIVNNIEIPQGVAGADMTATGWYNPITMGQRSGGFNPDFTASDGLPAGDPYGSMAALSVVVPTQISNAQSLPRIQVLVRGVQLERLQEDGTSLGFSFVNNPGWVLLDVLRRSGWTLPELDIASFVKAAEYCDQPVQTTDVHGNTVTVPRYQCNLVVRKRRSAADVVRGIRSASTLLLGFSADGLLQLRAESSIDVQQAEKPIGTNSTEDLNGGWPVFEFSDGSAEFSGIVRKPNGEPHLRFFSRSTSETPNRLSVEFQDEFNEYQQDSLSMVDVDDAVAAGQEVSAALTALGLPNFDQATRVARLQLNKFMRGNLYVEFGTSVRGFGLVPGDIIAITYQKEGLTRQPFRIVRIAPGVNFRTAVITAQIHDDAWYTGTGAAGTGSRRQAAFGVGIPRPLVGAAFSIAETPKETADGSVAVSLSVSFTAPSLPAGTGIGIPLVSLTPTIGATGGSIKGGQTLYYAVSGVDEQGAESVLSFSVKAVIASGSNANAVTLNNLSFSAGTASFHVYRGATPAQLVRIASAVPVSGQFTDSGASLTTVIGPPDENYDHSNFYWRLEQQPESAVVTATANSVTNPVLTMLPNEFRGMTIRISAGRGVGQERAVTATTATTVNVSPGWTVTPDATSKFVIADPSWRFGALSVSGPAEFDVPNRTGLTVHVLGRSANVHDQECAVSLSPVIRWRIGGSAGGSDSDVPGAPVYGFSLTGQGVIELGGIGFSSLANTNTVTSGTVTLLFWDELNTVPPDTLAASITDADLTLTLIAVGPAVVGDVLQIQREILVVTAVDTAGSTYTVERGAYSSTAAAHEMAAAKVYLLSRRTYIAPFARGFFGSPSSGSYSYPMYLPDVRVAAAELFVTNEVGNSAAKQYALTLTADSGMRTLSGGQYSIQVDGAVAIQNDAAPPLVIEDARAVRDIYAVLGEATTSGDIQVRLKQDGVDYCELTIPGGTFVSNSIDGFGLPPLQAKSKLTLDVIAVPQDPSIFPGRDLTVTMRL